MKTLFSLFLAITLIFLYIAYYFYSFVLDLVLFSAFFLSIFAFGTFIVKKSDSADIFQPYYLISILLFLYSAASILYMSEFGLTLYGEHVSNKSYLTFISATLFTQLGITLGFIFQSHAFKEKEKAYSDNKKYKHEVISINFLFVPTLILGLVFMPFYYQEFLPSYAVSYSEWSLQSRVDTIGDNSSGLREILFLTLPTLLILCSSIHIVFTEKYNIFYRLLFVLILFSYTYTQFLSGSRYSVIVVLLMISIFINYRIRKFTALEIVLGGVFVYILINLLSLLRATSDPIEMFYLLTEEIGLSGLSFLSLQSSGELLTGLNAVRIIEGIDSGEINFKYGTLFFNQILNFIPQVIWAGRPEVASVLYVQTFYPGVYESGGGFGFSVVAEGYWEAGLAGCLFYGFMTGLVSEKIFQMFLRRKGSDVYIFLYALIFSRLVISLNRSGLIAALKSSLIIAVPILLIIIIYKIYIIFGKK